MSIAATPSTSDKPRKESIVKSKSILKELISYCVQCPPTSVNIASSIKYCPQCAKWSVNMTDNLFKCEHCKEMALADETETGILWTYIQKWISTSGDNVFSTVSSIFQKKKKNLFPKTQMN